MVAIYENPYCGTVLKVPVPGKDEGEESMRKV
jgi:hypothetical protein